jgi:CheY-like chemotaxis protein
LKPIDGPREKRNDIMEQRHKILLLDDDPELLALYREILTQLPSRPEVFTASNGARAMAMLESEPFHLLISDLKMPKMDGLQVLSIVRRKHPQLRTVALTAVMDEQFRSRAYALGVDLFWHKPNTEQEIKMFLECLESLLGREKEGGFRGVQSKSLVDIIQLECISQSSSVLRITNGPLSGRIWIQEGELIDSDAGDLKGEEALKKILAWRAGNFESLAPEPGRPRVIFKSYNALLLESAQAQDEARVGVNAEGTSVAATSPMAQLAHVEGMEFVLILKAGQAAPQAARGLENPERMIAWTRQTLEHFRALGERLNAGSIEDIEGLGPQRHVALAGQGDTEFCVGWQPSMTKDVIREKMKQVLALWVS